MDLLVRCSLYWRPWVIVRSSLGFITNNRVLLFVYLFAEAVFSVFTLMCLLASLVDDALLHL